MYEIKAFLSIVFDLTIDRSATSRIFCFKSTSIPYTALLLINVCHMKNALVYNIGTRRMFFV